MTRTLRLFALLAIASAAHAQGPSADWRTITTPHFRIHYPAQYEAWATRVASRVESIRAAVVKEVGYDAPTRIDLIVSNPIAQANGYAYALVDSPRMVFYTEPPGPEEQIGAYSDWIDLLATHEITHLMHLLRPSRNPLQHALERFVLPLAPITLDAPRWVVEVYAPVVEGRLTGAGRPSSTLRAAVLRKWASSGRMPAYSQLNSDTRFLGMSMAYLAGSAYLEWLEQRTGDGSLRRLWARMTARQRRPFGVSFSGIFGDSPDRLYGRFVAELTASAVAVNRSSEMREGELWQLTPRASGDPAVSPDGSQIAVVLRARNKPARLVIWSTGAPEEEKKKLEERITKMIERDPDDYPPTAGGPVPRKVLYALTPADGGSIETPRWRPDGKSILYSHRQPDRDGFLHGDLFLWTPATGENRRVTQLADVFDADPVSESEAIAVRSRYGATQLAMVDLVAGSVRAITEPEIDAVYSHPRVNREKTRVAYIAHRTGTWTLFVRDLVAGTTTAQLSDASVASPEWSGNQIYATVSTRGFAEVNRIEENGDRKPVTLSSGGSFQPAPAPDGRLFFMGLDPDGFVLRVIDGRSNAPQPPPYDPTLVPALPPAAATTAPFVSQELSPARPYGLGRQEISWLVGETIAPSQSAVEAGVRVGDVIGRLDTIALASLGSGNGQRGIGIASTWRAWPVAVSAHLFHADDHLVKRGGLEVRGSWSMQRPLLTWTAGAGALAGNPLAIRFVESTLRSRQMLMASDWRADEEVRLSGEEGSVSHFRGVAGASLRTGSFSVTGRYQHDEPHGDGQIDIGGAESSILPRSATPTRVFDPALPAGTLTGRYYDGIRFETQVPGVPATFFYQRHRTNTASLSLTGLQVTFSSLAEPLLGLPALDLTAGVARVLDKPLHNRTKWWFAMRWRP